MVNAFKAVIDGKSDSLKEVFEENLDELFFAASEMPHVRVKGLMSIMPIETKLLFLNLTPQPKVGYAYPRGKGYLFCLYDEICRFM